MPTAVVTPVYGWGFVETVDGKLAAPFTVEIAEAGVDIGQPAPGWRGSVVDTGHKYYGFSVAMLPRHADWDGVVYLWVKDAEKVIFDGLANAEGLACTWKIDGITDIK